jgi:hypothetical protein
VHPDGTGLKKLTAFKPGAIVGSSSFSPDGTSIVLASTFQGGARLRQMPLRPLGSINAPSSRR